MNLHTNLFVLRLRDEGIPVPQVGETIEYNSRKWKVMEVEHLPKTNPLYTNGVLYMEEHTFVLEEVCVA